MMMMMMMMKIIIIIIIIIIIQYMDPERMSHCIHLTQVIFRVI